MVAHRADFIDIDEGRPRKEAVVPEELEFGRVEVARGQVRVMLAKPREPRGVVWCVAGDCDRSSVCAAGDERRDQGIAT